MTTGAVELTVSLNGGADFDGGDSSRDARARFPIGRPAAVAAVGAVEPAGATEGGSTGQLLGAAVLELSVNGSGGWVAGAGDGAS